MAEGYLRHFAQGKAVIYSAGIETHGVNPGAVAAMLDDGIDISHHTSNHIDAFGDISFDYVITVCDHARESCPYLPTSARMFHHNFPDPAKAVGTDPEIQAQFKKVRDSIKQYCRDFILHHC